MTKKRIFDIVLSFLLLIILLMPMIIIAFIIYIKMGQPIFFIQERAGLNGQKFKIIKFRTMEIKEIDFKKNEIEENIRITKLGKLLRETSLDELPELLNVIKGDMSLVGPRPLLHEYVILYNEEQIKRLRLKPGITGWAQINGRNSLSWDDKFKYDLWYINNNNILIDMEIIIKTIAIVLMRKGINSNNDKMMPRFKGNK